MALGVLNRLKQIRPTDWVFVVAIALVLMMWVRSYFYAEHFYLVAQVGVALASDVGMAEFTVGMAEGARTEYMTRSPGGSLNAEESRWYPQIHSFHNSAIDWAVTLAIPYWLLVALLAGLYGSIKWRMRKVQRRSDAEAAR